MPHLASPVFLPERVVLCVALVPLHLPPAVPPRFALISLLGKGSYFRCSRAGEYAGPRCVQLRTEEGGEYTRLVFAECADSVRP